MFSVYTNSDSKAVHFGSSLIIKRLILYLLPTQGVLLMKVSVENVKNIWLQWGLQETQILIGTTWTCVSKIELTIYQNYLIVCQ